MTFAMRNSDLPNRKRTHSRYVRSRFSAASVLASLCLVLFFLSTGCGVGGGGGGSTKNPPPPPPPTATVGVSPATAIVNLGAMQQFGATVTNTTNTSVVWSVNGVAGGNAILGTISSAGNYTAPQTLPAPAVVAISATSAASSSASGSALVTIDDGFTFTLAGPTALNSGVSGAYAATLVPVANSNPSTVVSWSVSGSGCSSCGTFVTSGANATYTAPITATPLAVVIVATPVADPNRFASLNVLIGASGKISVVVSPANANVTVDTSEAFSAQVSGTTNSAVTWDVNGVVGGNSTVGSVTNSAGSDSTMYTAPLAVPSPPNVTIHATSTASAAASGTAGVTITAVVTNPNAPSISQLLPASAFAGSAGSFSLEVNGGNFVASGASASSVISIAGIARLTTCASSTACTATLTAADLAAAGNLVVAVQNPDGTESNTVNFVVATETTSPGNIPLTPADPSANGENIFVVEPSTAGSNAPSSNVTLAIQAMGIFVTSTSTCTLGASPIALHRPASGSATIDICVFSVSGLDSSYAFSVTGPATPDITIVAKQPLGLGMVDLTLSVPSTAQAGARSLFVENANKDKAVASAALEVK